MLSGKGRISTESPQIWFADFHTTLKSKQSLLSLTRLSTNLWRQNDSDWQCTCQGTHVTPYVRTNWWRHSRWLTDKDGSLLRFFLTKCRPLEHVFSLNKYTAKATIEGIKQRGALCFEVKSKRADLFNREPINQRYVLMCHLTLKID